MRRHHIRVLGIAVTGALAIAGCGKGSADDDARSERAWKTTWATTVHDSSSNWPRLIALLLTSSGLEANEQTFRNEVTVSIGGGRVRLRLSNAFGHSPLTIGAVSIADAGATRSTGAPTPLAVTFSGERSVTIPPGEERLSDPVRLRVSPLADLIVSIYVPRSDGVTFHAGTGRWVKASPPGSGDHTGDTSSDAFTRPTQAYFWLDGIEVEAPGEAGTVAVVGDSISDFGAPLNLFWQEPVWPELLARRLAAEDGRGVSRGVASDALAGSAAVYTDGFLCRPTAVERLDRGVLDRAGVTHAIVYIGTNDIGSGIESAEPIIEGLSNIARRLRVSGIAPIGTTLAPRSDRSYQPDRMEPMRRRVNDWIRSSDAFDAVIDFDELLRDPSNPLVLKPEYDSGDHLHPGAAGERVMAEAIDLDLFRAPN